MDYLGGVAAAIMRLPVSDPRVLRSIASLQGQCLIFAKQVPPSMARKWGPAAGGIDALADHVAEFSLGGMRAIAQLEQPA